MRIVCQQTLFVIFEKAAKFENCCLLLIVGVALRINLKKKNSVDHEKINLKTI